MSGITMEVIKEAVDAQGTAFEEFKKTNDSRLAEIEKKGAADPLIDDKLDKIEKSLAGHEDLNQKLTKAEQGAKSMAEQIAAIKEQADRLETALKRTPKGNDDKEEDTYHKAFSAYMRLANTEDAPAEVRAVIRETMADLKTKGILASDDTAGGYLVAPPAIEAGILKDVIEQSPIRAVARVTQIGTRELILPKRTGVFAATRVSEVATRSETTGYGFGQLKIDAPEMYAYVPISVQMLEDTAYNLEAEVAADFAEQFAVLEGTESVTGNENDELEGFCVNATILAAHVASGHASALTADGLINLYHALKSVYARTAVWTLNRTTLGAVRKLKDGTGAYIWQPGLANGLPNSIQGRPYVEFPDMADVGAGTYPIAFGDFQKGYRVVDRVNLSILRDPYTLANSGQIKFLARRRVGGKVVQAEAIKVLLVEAS